MLMVPTGGKCQIYPSLLSAFCTGMLSCMPAMEEQAKKKKSELSDCRVAVDFVWILFFVSLNLFYRIVAGI